MRGRRSSPSTWATETAMPSRSARARTSSARPAGLRPPALVTTRMPRSTQVPSTSSIWVRKVWAHPREGSRWRPFQRMSMVSSASQSPVRTSMGPPSTISRAADRRSP